MKLSRLVRFRWVGATIEVDCVLTVTVDTRCKSREGYEERGVDHGYVLRNDVAACSFLVWNIEQNIALEMRLEKYGALTAPLILTATCITPALCHAHLVNTAVLDASS